MNYRKFGKTDLLVSETGFGAWAIGGPAMAGNIPIGWGNSDDKDSTAALKAALDNGINFFDTADFYGLGHSEKLIGKVFSNSDKVIVATKVGQKPGTDRPVEIDYSRKYLLNACDASLKRLRRESIDYYQLHVASVADLEKGECVDAMERLRDSGKIRYWGISLFTFNPAPEAEWLMQRGLGDGFQLVLNIINQKSLPLLKRMKEKEYGIIARMPLQFGLLTGKFSTETKFSEDDHRKFRLTESIIRESENMLKPVWSIAEKYGMSKTDLALAFIFSHPEISTVIPGIRTANQAAENAKTSRHLTQLDMEAIHEMYAPVFEKLVDKMKTLG